MSTDQYIATHTLLGLDAATQKDVDVLDVDRYSGMYVLGVQGVGKSSLLEWLIYQDIDNKDTAVIVIDPHADLIDHIIAQLPERRLAKTYLLDIEDTAYPFGLNLFAIAKDANTTQQQQALDRVMHVFEKCFPDTSRMLLEKYLGNIAPVFFANAGSGYGMTDIPTFLRNDAFRSRLTKNSRLFIRQFWDEEYSSLSPSKKQGETASLATRLNRFMRSPIAGNIIGQKASTIDFRRAIENKEILLIRLPVKTLKEDAQLIGTMLIAQIYAAIFSFADTPQEHRPGFSLFVDEFQHFATSDFADMFTEGRKFGSRVCVAHQFREQLPDYLSKATLTARTIVTFQATHEDAMKMSHLYPVEAKVDPTTMPGDIVRYLVRNGHTDPRASRYISSELSIILKINHASDLASMNTLFIDCMRDGNANRDIPYNLMSLFTRRSFTWNKYEETVEKAKPFFEMGGSMPDTHKAKPAFYLLLKPDVFTKTEQLQAAAIQGAWGKKNRLIRIEGVNEILAYIADFRHLMQVLAANPLGKLEAPNASEVAAQIVNLPRRQAMVRVGKETSQIKTLDTPKAVTPAALRERKQIITEQTRAKYCRPAAEVENQILQRLGMIEKMPQKTETDDQPEPPTDKSGDTNAQEIYTPYEEI